MKTKSATVAQVPTATLPGESAERGSGPAQPRGCSHFKLRQLSRRVGRFYDGALADETGLKTSQYSLLSHVQWLQPVRPADLAAQMELTPSTLTRNLQPLLAQGWLAIGPGADGRSRLITLTPEGQAKRLQAQQVWKRAQRAFNAQLGLERVQALHALIDDCMAVLAQDADADALT